MEKNALPSWALPAGIIAVIVIVLGLWILGIYNTEIQLDLNVQGAQANIEVEHQRRFDLVPQLVNTIKGSANFEEGILEKVTSLRTQWQSQTNLSDKIETANEFEGALSKLILTVEAYPDLKTNTLFQDLLVQLEGTENRISVARIRYNEAAQEYNFYIRKIPNNFFFGGKQAKIFWEAPEGAENPVSVPTDFLE
jgi:LemA protein